MRRSRVPIATQQTLDPSTAAARAAYAVEHPTRPRNRLQTPATSTTSNPTTTLPQPIITETEITLARNNLQDLDQLIQQYQTWSLASQSNLADLRSRIEAQILTFKAIVSGKKIHRKNLATLYGNIKSLENLIPLEQTHGSEDLIDLDLITDEILKKIQREHFIDTVGKEKKALLRKISLEHAELTARMQLEKELAESNFLRLVGEHHQLLIQTKQRATCTEVSIQTEHQAQLASSAAQTDPIIDTNPARAQENTQALEALLQRLLATLEEERTHHLATIERITTTFQQELQEKQAQLTRIFLDQFAALQQQHAAATATTERTLADSQQTLLTEIIAHLTETHQLEMRQLQTDYETRFAQETNSLRQLLEDERRSFSSQLDALTRQNLALREEVEALRAAFTQRLDELTSAHKRELAAARNTQERMEAENEKLNAQLIKYEALIEQLRQQKLEDDNAHRAHEQQMQAMLSMMMVSMQETQARLLEMQSEQKERPMLVVTPSTSNTAALEARIAALEAQLTEAQRTETPTRLDTTIQTEEIPEEIARSITLPPLAPVEPPQEDGEAKQLEQHAPEIEGLVADEEKKRTLIASKEKENRDTVERLAVNNLSEIDLNAEYEATLARNEALFKKFQETNAKVIAAKGKSYFDDYLETSEQKQAVITRISPDTDEKKESPTKPSTRYDDVTFGELESTTYTKSPTSRAHNRTTFSAKKAHDTEPPENTKRIVRETKLLDEKTKKRDIVWRFEGKPGLSLEQQFEDLAYKTYLFDHAEADALAAEIESLKNADHESEEHVRYLELCEVQKNTKLSEFGNLVVPHQSDTYRRNYTARDFKEIAALKIPAHIPRLTPAEFFALKAHLRYFEKVSIRGVEFARTAVEATTLPQL